MIAGWYTNGTEIVFACGGSMFASISAAASANDGYVIGVDVDQSSQSDTVVTSAMKGIDQAAILGLEPPLRRHLGRDRRQDHHPRRQ